MPKLAFPESTLDLAWLWPWSMVSAIGNCKPMPGSALGSHVAHPWVIFVSFVREDTVVTRVDHSCFRSPDP
ncbi:hypothetical protein BC567DRAFT_229985 [Phyllosticta citribraziliensis]